MEKEDENKQWRATEQVTVPLVLQLISEVVNKNLHCPTATYYFVILFYSNPGKPGAVLAACLLGLEHPCSS